MPTLAPWRAETPCQKKRARPTAAPFANHVAISSHPAYQGTILRRPFFFLLLDSFCPFVLFPFSVERLRAVRRLRWVRSAVRAAAVPLRRSCHRATSPSGRRCGHRIGCRVRCRRLRRWCRRRLRVSRSAGAREECLPPAGSLVSPPEVAPPVPGVTISTTAPVPAPLLAAQLRPVPGRQNVRRGRIVRFRLKVRFAGSGRRDVLRVRRRSHQSQRLLDHAVALPRRILFRRHPCQRLRIGLRHGHLERRQLCSSSRPPAGDNG